MSLATMPAIQFRELNMEDRKRLCQINHMTSANTALRILRSSCIWGTDLDRMANFSLNQVPVDRLDEPQEVSLAFEFSGPVELVSAAAPSASYAPDRLYIYVSQWPSTPTIRGMKVWAARIAPGSTKYLTCTCTAFTREFLDRTVRDSTARLQHSELQDRVARKPSLRVPNSDEERMEIAARFGISTYSPYRRMMVRIQISAERVREFFESKKI